MLAKPFFTGVAIVLAQLCPAAFGDSITSFSISGTSIPISYATGKLFSGTSSCSASGTDMAACSATNTVAPVTVSGYADASYGHLGFQGNWNAAYSPGTGPALLGGMESQVTSSASSSAFISFGADQPSSITLTFLESGSVPGGIAELGIPRYSIQVGDDAPWTFTGMFGASGTVVHTQTFAVDPGADGILVTLSGTFNGSNPLNEFSSGGSYTDMLDMQTAGFFAVTGQAVPEPSALWLAAGGIGVLAAIRRKSRRSAI